MSISTVRAFSAFVAIVAFVSSAVRADQKEDVKLGKICPDKVECQLLGDVTNDRDPSVSFLKLIIAPKDHKTVNGLYIRTEKRDDKKNVTQATRSVNDIVKGVALDDSGHNAVVLKGSIDSKQGVAPVQITYLTNGLLDTLGWGDPHETCKLDLKRDKNGVWQMWNAYNHQLIKEVRVITWKLGIRTLQNVCPEKKKQQRYAYVSRLFPQLDRGDSFRLLDSELEQRSE